MPSFDRRNFLGVSLTALAAFHEQTVFAAKDSKKPSIALPVLPIFTKPVEPRETMFLTWQRDPTTTITVQWIGATALGAPKIEVATLEKDAVWTPFAIQSRPYHPLTDLRVFRAEATGLKPGTEYQFRLPKQTHVHRFRTMPAKATSSFQFVSGGDCGVNDHVVANNVLAARQNPMFALIGGDIAYDNGHDVKSNLNFYRNYAKHMIDGRGRMIPMVVCIGNHEVKGGYNAKRSDGPMFFALHDGLFNERSYASLDFGDYLSLVLLDSGHVAPIDGEQTSWLDKTLAARAERAHVIVANHVPAYPSYRMAEATDKAKTGTGQLNRAQWSPLFQKHNVDLVLEHHDHTFKRTHPIKDGLADARGVVYLGDGSWGKLRAPKAAESRPYLAVSDESYHLTVHRIEGEQRFHLALREGGGIVDIFNTQSKRPQRSMGRGA